ncbi:MAG TPA: cysteine rich repeat-containing protein [Syntrophorhabdaceae bacterium]|nr:cysteine rich repeat-containing protein [Syntrophorhabdaceae bacterium]
MKQLILAALLSVTLTLPTGLAFADSAQPGPRLNGHCKEDVNQFCSEMQPGGGRIANCLREHAKDLSQGCKAAIKNRMRRQQQQHPNGPTQPPASAK